ncbi:reverse transcriptase domain-containing protein [Tanacetum coccineum]
MINQGITAALTARDANTNGVDSHNSESGARRNERATRECTYPDFMKCQPLNFKGTEGVFELTQWIEKMETVFRISNCSVENEIKTVGNDIAYAMTWTELKKKITDKYCPRTEIKKLEVELWELKVKESDKIEKYVGGLLDMIHGSVVASKPKTMQEATEMPIEVMDKRIHTFTDCQTKSKRKFEDTSRNTHNQQQQHNKRQNTGRAYTAGSGKKKPYGRSKPLCSKCNYHHDGPCAPKCHKCNKVGHFARDCRSTTNANNANHQRGTGSGQKPTCFECGAQGHFKRECPKLKNNNNRGNQVGGGNAPAKVYAVGHAGTNPDSNVVTGTFLLNNRYASILFDTGADRSFVSTAFSSQIDITPTALDHYYDVELADGRIIGDASGRSHEAEATHRGTKADKETSDSDDRHVMQTQMASTATIPSEQGARRNERAPRECTYPDFMKCQPLNFKGTEGVVELTQWIEKTETVFCISNYSVENQIKFSTCNLLGNALTWWNSHVMTFGCTHLEALTWIMSSYRKSFTMLKCKDGKSTAFIIGNHGSSYSKVTHSSQIDGILETVAHNKDHSKPIKGTNDYVDNIDVDVTEDLLRENFNHCIQYGKKKRSKVAIPKDVEVSMPFHLPSVTQPPLFAIWVNICFDQSSLDDDKSVSTGIPSTRYSEKGQKQSKTDKNEPEKGKSVKKSKSTSQKVSSQSQQVKAEYETKEKY